MINTKSRLVIYKDTIQNIDMAKTENFENRNHYDCKGKNGQLKKHLNNNKIPVQE